MRHIELHFLNLHNNMHIEVCTDQRTIKPVLATFLVLGLRYPGLQDERETPKHSSRRISSLVTSQASGKGFAVGSRDPSTKQINGHRDFGAAKLPDI
jgi:hypothetical protein